MTDSIDAGGDPAAPPAAAPKPGRSAKAKKPAADVGVKPDAEAASPSGAPSAGAARQFVIFSIAGESFAVALAAVREIIRVPAIVKLPLAPAALEGLANLRGSVLPVVNTRRLFGLAERAHDDATRVVILDGARPVGIVVDDVANVVSVEADRIEMAGAITTTVRSDLLEGVIKAEGERGMVMVLDALAMIAREFDSFEARGPETALRMQAVAQTAAESGHDDQMQLVSFDVAGQEYGLEITCVQEIVQVPERITRVPKAAAAVLGVMNLRDRLLPVLSMRALFGMEPAPLADHNRVVVVSLDGGQTSVGLVMDRVREVLRVPRSLIDPMPPLLAADAQLRDITAVCRLDEGRRIVSVLSADQIFDDGALRGSLAALTEQGQSMDSSETVSDSSDEEQFVVFRLMNEEYGVAIAAVQEILRLPETIARVPRSPDFIEGVINLRGAVIPLVDQRSRFGLPVQERNDRQRVMVFTIRGVQTGFIVDSVSEVMRIARAQIEDAPELALEQAQMIRRVANLAERQRMILLLESDRLLDGAELDALDAA